MIGIRLDFPSNLKTREAEKTLETDVNRLDYSFQTVKDRHSPTGKRYLWKGWGTLGVFIEDLESTTAGAMHKPAISSSSDFLIHRDGLPWETGWPTDSCLSMVSSTLIRILLLQHSVTYTGKAPFGNSSDVLPAPKGDAKKEAWKSPVLCKQFSSRM